MWVVVIFLLATETMTTVASNSRLGMSFQIVALAMAEEMAVEIVNLLPLFLPVPPLLETCDLLFQASVVALFRVSFGVSRLTFVMLWRVNHRQALHLLGKSVFLVMSSVTLESSAMAFALEHAIVS